LPWYITVSTHRNKYDTSLQFLEVLLFLWNTKTAKNTNHPQNQQTSNELNNICKINNSFDKQNKLLYNETSYWQIKQKTSTKKKRNISFREYWKYPLKHNVLNFDELCSEISTFSQRKFKGEYERCMEWGYPFQKAHNVINMKRRVWRYHRGIQTP
jgi:hypothetical protein